MTLEEAMLIVEVGPCLLAMGAIGARDRMMGVGAVPKEGLASSRHNGWAGAMRECVDGFKLIIWKGQSIPSVESSSKMGAGGKILSSPTEKNI